MKGQSDLLGSLGEPSKEEMDASKLCFQLQNSFKSFIQEKNSSTAEKEFTQFLIYFKWFLDEEKNQRLVGYFLPVMLHNALINTIQIPFNQTIVNQVFELLSITIQKKIDFLESSSFINFFIFLSDGDELKFNILKSNEDVIFFIFSNPIFSKDFLGNKDLFFLTFKKFFFEIDSPQLTAFYLNIFCEHFPKSDIALINLEQIINSVLNDNPKESIYPSLAVVLAKLFSLNPKYQKYFNDSHNFTIISELLFNASFETITDCFEELVFTNPPNYFLLQNIVGFYQNNPRIQRQFFNWIFTLAEQNPDILTTVNSIVPFSSWVVHQTSVADLISSIKVINQLNNQFVAQFLSPLFSLLCKGESDLQNYIISIQIIENQILRRQISLAFLLDSLFLNAFVVRPSVDLLCQIFQNSYTFAQLVFDIYALPKAKIIRQEVLGKIIQAAAYNSEISHIISVFVVISDSNKNIYDIMDLIETSRNGELCEALASAFPKSDIVTKRFLQENGIRWLDRIFNANIIDLKMYQIMLTNISTRTPVKEIDEYIDSLPKTHPLFTLTENEYRVMIFGMEDPQDFYPIKIYSLFNRIPCPWSIDPYNASIIGKNILSKYDDIMNLPIIPEIGNRYITNKVFHLFLKAPTSLEQFCDASYDHFPLFQVFEFNEDHVFEMSFNSLSFWFKFGSSVDASLKIPFFHVSKFQLFIKNSVLLANYEGTEYEAPIDPLKWNHIVVSIKSERASHTIKIFVNLNKAIFRSPNRLNELSCFGFLVYASFLFIGPAVRLYNDKCTEMARLFEMGPSSMDPMQENKLITPFSPIPIDKNILPVPYFGFPAHFQSKKKLDLFFDTIRSSSSEEGFDKLISLCFKLSVILKKMVPNFFHYFLEFLSSVPNRITKERLLSCLTFFGNQMGKIKLLNEILSFKHFWETTSNDLILFSLVTYFKTFDFYEEIDQFQIFLSSLALTNPKSKYIITSLLVNAATLPKCKKCTMALFVCHHFFNKIASKEIQCSQININNCNNESNDLIQSQEEERNQSVTQPYEQTNKSNSSVQCNFTENDKTISNHIFDEHLLLFQEVQNSVLQFTFCQCIGDFITQTGKLDVIKAFLPMEDLFSLFIVSQTSFKANLFHIFALIEKSCSGYMNIDGMFLSAMAPLFPYQSVWDDVMSLITDDGKTVARPFMMPLLMILVWGLAIASYHSAAKTGKQLQFQFTKEIRFCAANAKIIATNKTTLHFIKTWFPTIFGFSRNNCETSSASIRLENVEIIPPKSADFSHFIWESVIRSADLPLKSSNFYTSEFVFCIHRSELTLLLIKILLSSTESQFINLFMPLILILFISDKEISETFISTFIHTILTYISESYSPDIPFSNMITVLHYLNHYGFLKLNQQAIISDIFVIMSVIFEFYNSNFKKISYNINLLLCDLFSTFDSQSLHLLFKVLLQHISIFTKIVQSTNSIDLYLRFFQKVFRHCSDVFDDFFNKFIVSAQLDSLKDPRVEALKRHEESQDKNLMSKWVKNINSLKSYRKTIKNAKDDIYTLMMTDILECSRTFSLTYFIARKRQIGMWENLTDLYKVINDIQKPFIHYNDMLKLYQEEPKDKSNRRLVPISLPFSLPRMFISLGPFELASKFILENELYSSVISSFDKFSKLAMFDCVLLRLNESIPTIASVSTKYLRLIPFCYCATINYPISNKEIFESFVHEVLNGFWGKTKFYEKRIIIKIPLNSILYISQKGNGNFTFWTTTCGTFCLHKVLNQTVFSQNNFTRRIPNFNFLLSKENIIENWTNGSLSTSQMINALNIFEKRDYIDLRKFPIFPQDLTIFGTTFPISETLAGNLAEGLSLGILKYSNTIELKENIDIVLDVLKQFNIEIKEDQIPNSDSRTPTFDVNSNILCQKIGENMPLWLQMDSDSFITTLPLLTIRVSSTYPYFIFIDKGSAMISLVDFKTKTRIFETHLPIFCLSQSISVSQNKMFFSVDFENNITHLYRVIFESGNPISFVFVNEKSFSYNQTTIVNGEELIACSFSERRICIWPFYGYPADVLVLEHPKKIKFVSFDDNSGTFWICNNHSCHLHNLNGEEISKISFEQKISAFEVLPQPISICNRCAICGFFDGSLAILSPMIESGEIKEKFLKKCHNSKIYRIAYHPNFSYFSTIDTNEAAYFWTKMNSNGPEIDINSFVYCPHCGKKASIICNSCKRVLCTECIIDKSHICQECCSLQLPEKQQ